MEASSNLRRFLCAHYLVNLFLALSFLILKHVPIFCRYVFEECTLEWRDQETLMFCICVILAKTRKATTWVQYIGKACMFAKAASLVLFFREEPVLGFAYGVICLIAMIMFPEPAYDGPENITYFRGPFLDHELEREPRVTWIIEFYAAWSPACVDFVPTFAEISNKYSLDNLKYGKIDVTRYPDVAAQVIAETILPNIISIHTSKTIRVETLINDHPFFLTPLFLQIIFLCSIKLTYRR